jgi:hypothetical protein
VFGPGLTFPASMYAFWSASAVSAREESLRRCSMVSETARCGVSPFIKCATIIANAPAEAPAVGCPWVSAEHCSARPYASTGEWRSPNGAERMTVPQPFEFGFTPGRAPWARPVMHALPGARRAYSHGWAARPSDAKGGMGSRWVSSHRRYASRTDSTSPPGRARSSPSAVKRVIWVSSETRL